MAGFADLAKKAAAAEKAKKNGGDAAPDGGGDGGPSAVAAAAAATTPPSSPKPTNNKLKNLSPFRRSPKPTKPSIATTAPATTAAEPTTTNSADENWMKATAALKVVAVAEKNRRAKESNKIADRKLVSAVSCEFWSPPPATSLKGKVAPKALTKYQNRRRLSIEIHRVTPFDDDDDDDDDEDDGDNGDGGGKGKKKASPSILSSLIGGVTSSRKKTKKMHSYEECVCRILVAPNKKLNREYRNKALRNMRSVQSSAEEFNEDMINDTHFGDEADADDDDASVGTTNEDGIAKDTVMALMDHGGKDYHGWKPRYSVPIDSIHVRQQHKKTATVVITLSKLKQERDLTFDTVEDCKRFVQEIEKQKRLEAERQEGRLKAALGDIVLPKLETVTWLFEIVSGYDLPIGDFTTSDPYVQCVFGQQQVHRTKHISATLDPIWTLKTGSLFILTTESRKLFLDDGMRFIIKDFDQLGKDEVLGIVHVKPQVWYQSKGERMEFKLHPPHGSKDTEVPGYLVLRIRRASEYDQKFMADYNNTKGTQGVASVDHPKATTNFVKTMTTFNKRKTKDGTVRYRIRPDPDPKRLEETEYMTDKDLRNEVMKPSQEWLDIGQGELGKIYLEVLGCEGLPNMDAGGFMGNKTDAFVSVVFEDSFARTNVIDDCLSPQFMPWTNRAFIFHMAHPSSVLNLAVFDFDGGLLDDHDLVGRVSIDLSTLLPDTEYVLHYNLHATNRVSDRPVQGQIKIRLRMEISDERKVALAALQPPPPIHVNAKKRRDFRVIRETCLGNVDEERYNVSTLKSYVEELQELQYVLFYLEDAALTLFLWRGHFEVNVLGRKIKLPLHSLNAFIFFTFLVEHPQLVPSFCFMSVAWMLIAVMGWRRNSANIWQHCYSYFEIMRMVVVGDSLVPPAKIDAYQNFDESKKEMESWVNRVEEAAKKAERAAAQAAIDEEERQKELEEIGEADGDIGTKTGGGGLGIDPVRAALYPIQLMLGMLCRVIRFIKNIIIWQESFFSFWITTGCIIMSVVCLFVPWFWMIHWTSRIIVWTIFGPWMKLVDLFYVSQIKPETEEERRLREKADKLKRKLATTEAADEARQIRENSAKLKAMKKYYFGRFSMQVPILKQDRYIDIPLPESTAEPYKEKQLTLAELAMEEAGYRRKRIPGQTLVGEMIPTVELDSFTQAPVGRATAHPERLQKGVPGAAKKGGGESTTSAYVKIVGVVVVAILA
eukprot:CAMPEP_0113512820 /NCGR_PEP_ID=MMETSP0014_2-20120614/39536_1 /TAXON_ID=2857 /ORGANISM="Nitzschia sp." /LENGTH=1224 /DNA_ID=CAMNT_0000409189 /DNA_START=63 /DNA_END=3733 /DNA_ORIENTATION=+ /assembly_acc=CAM_ASM_000159